MKTATGGSDSSDTRCAVEQAADELYTALGVQPHYIMVQMHAVHDAAIVQTFLRERFPGAQIHGATSCCGSMTEKGVFFSGNGGLALFGIHDDNGAYGACLVAGENNPAKMVLAALDRALAAVDREGELPELVFITCSPGIEEEVLGALVRRLGKDTPIIGGSAADDDIAGRWVLFDRCSSSSSGCLISVFFSSSAMGSSFQCAYIPTLKQAEITASSGRVIMELDGKPAAGVYLRWIDSSRSIPISGHEPIYRETTLVPLGRPAGVLSGVRMFLLSHPVSITSDGYLLVNTEVVCGETVTLMSGSASILLNRASRTCSFAARMANTTGGRPAGAIVVFCAGCMMAVHDRLEELRLGVVKALGGAPFIMAFTFGEQGQIIPGEQCHGNLMTTSLVWGDR